MRDDFKAASRLRLKESKLLHDNGAPEGSFYLGGYVVEASLKFIDKTVNGSNVRSHSLVNLKGPLRRMSQNEILQNLCNEILELMESSDLLKNWEVAYRYQGKVSILTADAMSKFQDEIAEIYKKSCAIEREWKQLQRGNEHDR